MTPLSRGLRRRALRDRVTLSLAAALAAALAVLLTGLTGCGKSSADPAKAESQDGPDNAVPPSKDEADLQKRASQLFDAVVHDDPALAEPFWFPREPFIPLKDPPNAAAYWEKLHTAYANDIHFLHASRPTWEGATFDRFELGTPPRWMDPGDEHNRIGYYRSLRSSIHYRVGTDEESFPVEVIITWQGRWLVTHLRKPRKK
jgi:hypothetical protein